MKYSESGGGGGVATIDSQFLSAINRVCDKTNELCKSEIGKKYNVSPIEAENIVKDEHAELDKRVSINIYFNEIAYVRKEFKVTFEEGREVTTSSFDEFEEALKRLSYYPEKMAISAGKYDLLSISIDVGERWGESPVRFEIKGTEESVTYLAHDIQNAIKNAESKNAWIYHSAVWVIATLLLFSFWMLGYAAIIYSQNRLVPQSVASVGILILSFLVMPTLLLSSEVVGRVRKNFPQLQFAWGIQHRRLRDRRAATGWVIASLALPIAFMLVPVFFSQ